MFLITSKRFITVKVDIVRAIRCQRRKMKTNIINGSEMSGSSVVIQDKVLIMKNFAIFAKQTILKVRVVLYQHIDYACREWRDKISFSNYILAYLLFHWY